MLALLALLLALAPAASARPVPEPYGAGVPRPEEIPPGMEKPSAVEPWFLRPMLHPIPNGMLIFLPIIDTNPNRGATYGVMPIWVVKGQGSDRIRQIHAPSLTYNGIFKATPTYRYYYYPKADSSLILRGSVSRVVNREVYAKYEDFSLFGRDWVGLLKGAYDVDGSGRFFGVGPNTSRDGQSNFTRDLLGYYGLLSWPIYGRWHMNVSHRLESQRVADGPINTLPSLGFLYPGAGASHRHQNSALRAFISYDSRDNPLVTTEGARAEFFAESSQRAMASEYVYQRYGTDLRYFYKPSPEGRFVTAGQVRFEQLIGDGIPFWLMPQLGGKYVFRAYGEGRYVDNGVVTSTIEERINVFQKRVAGVVTEFEVAPFAGLATVFASPGRMARRYARPVVGGAVRAVARPQVVGSIDLGVGQEGLATFMDINYSF